MQLPRRKGRPQYWSVSPEEDERPGMAGLYMTCSKCGRLIRAEHGPVCLGCYAPKAKRKREKRRARKEHKAEEEMLAQIRELARTTPLSTVEAARALHAPLELVQELVLVEQRLAEACAQVWGRVRRDRGFGA